ncbi:MAG: hypothetical protein JNK29_03575 [Anaerolineales bacterium]|nr:hypothetical protein [Anaerolineales bacterium]
MTRTLKRGAFWLLALAGLLFLWWLRAQQPPNTVDDAYITFRDARNWIEGVGFVYNAGEHVLGTTTPAYTVLLALAALLSGFHDFPRLAVAVNAGCDALTFVLLLRLTARLTGRRWLGLLLALLFTLDARLIDFSTGGMESSFNLLSLVLALTLFFHDRPRLAVVAAGLAVLVRPDGATLAAALFLALGLPVLRQPRRWPWVEAGLFLAVVGPWLIFAFAYFGQPIPQSVLAKSEVYRLEAGLAFRAFLIQLRTVFPFSLPPLHDPEPLARQLLQALTPAALVGLGLWAAQRRHRAAWALGAYFIFFIAFFSAGNPLWLGWYEIPLLPLYQMLIIAAAHWLGQRAAGRLPVALARRLRLPALLPFLAALVLAVPQLSRLNALPWEHAQRPRFVVNSSFNKEREADYVLLARMLAPAAAAGRQVAIPEIGAFGWVYRGRIFDTTGLVTPETLQYFPLPPEIPVGLYTVPRRMILDRQPDLFITFDSFIAEDLRPDAPDFLALYQPAIGIVSRATYPTQRLVAYRRRDLPAEMTLPPGLTPYPVEFDAGRLRLEGYFTSFGATPDYAYLEVTALWQAGADAAGRDLLVRADLATADGQPLFQILNYPGDGLFPTPSWEPGEFVIDRYQLKLPAGAAPGQAYRVQLTLLDNVTGEVVPAMPAGPARVSDHIVILPEQTAP